MGSVVKVSGLVHYLKSLVSADSILQGIIVEGEISNFTRHKSGHWYFSLKDEKARIACVMFASNASRVTFIPKEGDKVLVKGSVSVFEASGAVQLYVSAMKPNGIGDLYQQYELLKKKLSQEGLFDDNHKKPIPKYPMRVGLVTGRNTAAREDVISTITRRWPIAEVLECPVLVQGNSASEEILGALKRMDTLGLDVILLVRGGGSIEDLWAFNHEGLARTIYSLNTPIITGVGHEVDYTIVDFVADLRAPTPTGAAEMAVPDRNEIKQQILKLKSAMQQSAYKKLQLQQQRLSSLKGSQVLSNPMSMMEQRSLLLMYMNERLNNAVSNKKEVRFQLNEMKQSLSHMIQLKMSLLSNRITQYKSDMNRSVHNRIDNEKEALAHQLVLMDAYSPLKVMTRGYSLVYKDQELLKSVKDIEVGDTIEIRLQDGTLMNEVKKKEFFHE